MDIFLVFYADKNKFRTQSGSLDHVSCSCQVLYKIFAFYRPRDFASASCSSSGFNTWTPSKTTVLNKAAKRRLSRQNSFKIVSVWYFRFIFLLYLAGWSSFSFLCVLSPAFLQGTMPPKARELFEGFPASSSIYDGFYSFVFLTGNSAFMSANHQICVLHPHDMMVFISKIKYNSNYCAILL